MGERKCRTEEYHQKFLEKEKREENETRVEKQKVEKEGEKYLPERRKREGMCVCLSL